MSDSTNFRALVQGQIDRLQRDLDECKAHLDAPGCPDPVLRLTMYSHYSDVICGLRIALDMLDLSEGTLAPERLDWSGDAHEG